MSKKTKAIRAMGKEQMLDRITELRKQLLKFNSADCSWHNTREPGQGKADKERNCKNTHNHE